MRLNQLKCKITFGNDINYYKTVPLYQHNTSVFHASVYIFVLCFCFDKMFPFCKLMQYGFSFERLFLALVIKN